MLSTSQKSRFLRRSNNLLPTKNGGMEARPGALQLLSGSVTDVTDWGSRLVVERGGRIQVFQSDGTLTDVDQAGRYVQGANFQALTDNATREDRLYIADGVRPLWYIALRNGSVVSESVQNAILDGSNNPYAIPVPTAITTWRGRLFLAYGSNRVQHCQFDAPDTWDPIWTLECQGKKEDRIIAVEPFGDTLICGLNHSTWSISGDSPLNFKRRPVSDVGCAGPDSIATDELAVYRVARDGIFSLSNQDALSGDIEDIFGVSSISDNMVIDKKQQLIFFVTRGRLFVLHMATQRVGEITGFDVRGVFEWEGQIGWYGKDGLWLLMGRDLPDTYADGSQANVSSVFDTWDDIPNINGDGRAFLPRVVFRGKGSARQNVNYELFVDGNSVFTDSQSLTDESVDTWADILASAASGENWPTRAVRREFVPLVTGESFRHQFSADCHIEILDLLPQYQFGGS